MITEETVHEKWITIQDFPNYQVSSLGKVRRAAPVCMKRKGGIYLYFKEAKIISSHINHGYPHVTISRDNKKITIAVHILVCLTFHGPKPSPQHEVGHRDGDRLNARADNLRWVTRSENENDRKLHGTDNQGERHGMAKLNDEKVMKIIKMISDGYDYITISQTFNISMATISFIRHGKAWRHVTQTGNHL
jgi:hypothetical protein